MKIYHYHSETKEFLGESEARLDPLESKKKSKNVYLLPAFATFIKPIQITEVNRAIIFETGEWREVPDYRDKFYYDPISLEKKTPDLGEEFPENVPTELPPSSFIKPKWENGKWVEGATQEELQNMEYEKAIADKIRQIAIDALIEEGELPPNYDRKELKHDSILK